MADCSALSDELMLTLYHEIWLCSPGIQPSASGLRPPFASGQRRLFSAVSLPLQVGNRDSLSWRSDSKLPADIGNLRIDLGQLVLQSDQCSLQYAGVAHSALCHESDYSWILGQNKARESFTWGVDGTERGLLRRRAA